MASFLAHEEQFQRLITCITIVIIFCAAGLVWTKIDLVNNIKIFHVSARAGSILQVATLSRHYFRYPIPGPSTLCIFAGNNYFGTI